MRKPFGLIGVFVAASIAAPPAFAAGVSVPMDEVRVLAFPQPVATVYVGNPTIADVTVIDSKHVFVLGKSFGTTNLIALNADNKPVVNEHVTVFGRTASTVVLQRGHAQVTYACTSGACQPSPVPGDDATAFSTAVGEIAAHQELGTKAAGVGVASNTGAAQ